MLYVVIPLCWAALFFLGKGLAALLWSLLLLGYLGLLYALTFTTMFAEEKYADRLQGWRSLLALSGRLVYGGFLSALYAFLIILLIYGPGLFQ